MIRKHKIIAFALLISLIFSAVSVAQAEELEFSEEKYCLAQNIYFEAGNQPLAGRIAVAHVTLNRMEHKQFPSKICKVIYQAKFKTNWKGKEVPIRNKCQFSWYCDGKSDKPTDSETWAECIKLAEKILEKYYPDITEEALWYHADSVNPYWTGQLNRTVTIDNHLFYN
jgi:N-acetylmuramoyl-L-alanine amidase